MTDRAEFLGAMSMGACLPIGIQASGALSATLGFSLPELQAKIAGALALQAQLAITPPTIGVQIDGVLALLAALEAQLALGLGGIDMQVSALIELLAELNISLGQLQVQVAFLAELDALLATAGIYLYRYDGTAAGLGAQMTAALSAGLPGGAGPTQECTAVMLIAATPAAQAALSASFAIST